MLRITWPRAVAALIVALVAAGVVVMLNDDNDSAAMSDRPTAARTTDEAVDAAGCGIDTRGGWTGHPSRRDVQLGPLVLKGGKQWARWRPNAFDGHGYKIPALLPNGAAVTLSVPETMRGRVGLVYSPAAQERLRTGVTGVRGADAAVRFTACPAEQAGRTGWPGGIVVDRPRCATLVVEVSGQAPVQRRVPLGRPCRAPA